MPGNVKVRLLDAPSFLDKDYDYSVPDALADEVRPGVFVTVPFGRSNNRQRGLVTAVGPRDPALAAVKPIFAVPTPHVFLSDLHFQQDAGHYADLVFNLVRIQCRRFSKTFLSRNWQFTSAAA